MVEEPDDERGISKVESLLTKGWLSYKLRWKYRVMEKDPPTWIALDIYLTYRSKAERIAAWLEATKSRSSQASFYRRIAELRKLGKLPEEAE